MGRRKSRDAWAQKYIFPGGRVDRGDGYISPSRPLRKVVLSRLEQGCTPHRAHACAIAAIRELWEETGLRLASPTQQREPLRKGVDPSWQGFLDEGFAPALDRLDLLCRAVTPPFAPKRFNARFFLADGDQVEGSLGGTGELQDLRWVSFAQAHKLDLPKITDAVLVVLKDLLDRRGAPVTERKIPLFKTVYGRHERILE